MTDRVQVGQHSIAYRRAGSGAPLVLLHGFLCDSRVWRTQLEGLADDFDVIAWDAPGAGESSAPPSEFTMAASSNANERGVVARITVGPARSSLLARHSSYLIRGPDQIWPLRV